jgi:hypothetical protein
MQCKANHLLHHHRQENAVHRRRLTVRVSLVDAALSRRILPRIGLQGLNN